MWPEFSVHDFQVCCPADGEHFVGFWPNWPLAGNDIFFVAADVNGPGLGCPRTRVAPGIGYPTGWQHPDEIGISANDMGIREYAGLGDCPPTTTGSTT
jgi:hypothetical protein